MPFWFKEQPRAILLPLCLCHHATPRHVSGHPRPSDAPSTRRGPPITEVASLSPSPRGRGLPEHTHPSPQLYFQVKPKPTASCAPAPAPTSRRSRADATLDGRFRPVCTQAPRPTAKEGAETPQGGGSARPYLSKSDNYHGLHYTAYGLRLSAFGLHPVIYTDTDRTYSQAEDSQGATKATVMLSGSSNRKTWQTPTPR